MYLDRNSTGPKGVGYLLVMTPATIYLPGARSLK